VRDGGITVRPDARPPAEPDAAPDPEAPMFVRIRVLLQARATDVLAERLVHAGERFSLVIEGREFGSCLAEAETLGDLVAIESVDEVVESWEQV
jgi:hypothetical protein